MNARRAACLSIVLVAVLLTANPGALGEDQKFEHAVVAKVSQPAILAADGHLLARERDAIQYQPEAYRGEWIVRTAIEPGVRVRRGEMLVAFETEFIERELDDARFDLETSVVGFRHQERGADLARDAVEDEILRTERDLVEARLRLQGWTEHQLASAREDARLNDASWKMSIGNMKEELAELEKMYAEDELVEATEELVLKRTRRSLEHRLGTYEQAIKKRAYKVKFDENRRAEALEVDLRLRERSYSRRRVTLEMEERNRRISLERGKRGLEAKERHLDKMRRDLDAMTVRAPRDGIVLHGSDVTDLKRHEAGDRLNPKQAFLTVVDPSVLTIRFQVPAKSLLRLATGQALEATPKVDGAKVLEGRVDTISLFASSDQKVTLLGTIRLPEPSPGAIGGIACSVKLRTGMEDVLVVPAGAIVKDGDKSYCHLKTADGTYERREVVVGETKENGVIVTKGLAEGDEVRLGDGDK